MTPVPSLVQGIALSADPNYKVLGAAYPWIARRLLTEQSPELRDTLRTLLYKKGRFQVFHHPVTLLHLETRHEAGMLIIITSTVVVVFLELHYTQQAPPCNHALCCSCCQATVQSTHNSCMARMLRLLPVPIKHWLMGMS